MAIKTNRGTSAATRPADSAPLVAQTPTSTERTVTLSVDVTESQRRRLRVATAANGTTVREVVTDLLEQWLSEHE